MGLDKSVKDHPDRKRWILSIRVTADVKQQLLALAEASGRSLSEEIMLRLERSLLIDEVRLAIREELQLIATGDD